MCMCLMAGECRNISSGPRLAKKLTVMEKIKMEAQTKYQYFESSQLEELKDSKKEVKHAARPNVCKQIGIRPYKKKGLSVKHLYWLMRVSKGEGRA
mmetsp:Transcript_16678/g.36811  ORF Transcript_16678/g.36811 Transcript_16678/m.36811 type:complete len:96 (-) Transcript_16678:939-1226(-)